MKNKRLFWILIILLVIIAGAAFPLYNLGKHYSYALTGITLWLNLAFYIELGVLERRLLPNYKTGKIALLNLGIIVVGMGCRYFLELGEVSNTYNFTLPNIVFHVVVTFMISMISYAASKSVMKATDE